MRRPTHDEVEHEITALDGLDTPSLQSRWRELFGIEPPPRMRSGFLRRAIAYRLQERAFGGLKPATKRLLRTYAEQARARRGDDTAAEGSGHAPRQRIVLAVGTRLLREWNGVMQVVEVVPDGLVWGGTTYRTLSAVAGAITGTKWSGPKFFGLGEAGGAAGRVSERQLVRQMSGGGPGGPDSMLRGNRPRSASRPTERAQVRGRAVDAPNADRGASGVEGTP